jgi:hypothetical protein
MEEHRLQVFENKMLRRISGLRRKNIPAELHNEKLHNCHILLVVLREIKSRRLRWTVYVYVAGIEEMRNSYNIFQVMSSIVGSVIFTIIYELGKKRISLLFVLFLMSKINEVSAYLNIFSAS